MTSAMRTSALCALAMILAILSGGAFAARLVTVYTASATPPPWAALPASSVREGPGDLQKPMPAPIPAPAATNHYASLGLPEVRFNVTSRYKLTVCIGTDAGAAVAGVIDTTQEAQAWDWLRAAGSARGRKAA